ncbi:MAG: response regulator, partial [Myxococcota bacterium]
AYGALARSPEAKLWRGAKVTIPVGSEPEGGHLQLLQGRLADDADTTPLIADDNIVELTDNDVVEDVAAAKPARTGSLIMVVDDEEDIRKLLATSLAKRGHAVVTVERGDEVLARVKQRPPDLILLDAMLPGVHGFEICKKLKGSAPFKHIPVIMVSAVYRGWRIAQDARDTYGADDYVEKPFKLARLLSRVDELLGEKTPIPGEKKVQPDAQAIFLRGIDHYQHKRYDEAERELREASRVDPLHVQALHALGNVLVIQERPFEAMNAYEEALELRPRLFPAIKNLALLYQRHGFRTKAAEMWERALETSPDDAARMQIAEQLAKLDE